MFIESATAARSIAKEIGSAGFFNPIDRSDVGMIERRQHLGLALEADHSLWIARERVGKELERDLAVQREVIGQVDLAHASMAKFFNHPIMA